MPRKRTLLAATVMGLAFAQTPCTSLASSTLSEATLAGNPPRHFKLLKSRAEAGNAVAQRLVAQAYRDCMRVNSNPAEFLKQHAATGPSNGGQQARIERLARDRVKDCAQVDGTADVTHEQIERWLKRASQNGDLPARALANMVRHPPFDQQEAENFLQEIIASKDPEAVFAYGNVMGGPVTENLGEAHAALVGEPTSSLAWMLAACRMGMECGPDSMLVANLCLFEQICAPGDYEQVLKSRITSVADREALDRQIDQVLNTVTP